MVEIKREKWGNKYVYVAREKGKILSRKQVKGSKFNLAQMKNIYKEQGSFSLKYKTSRERLSNVEIVSKIQPTKIENRVEKIPLKSSSKFAMYSVQGYLGKDLIVANSSKDAGTDSYKRQEAWISFLELVSYKMNAEDYDADEGLKHIDKVKGLSEGWIYFTKI